MAEITQDHDLLIRVDENVRSMNTRLDNMQRDSAAQITELRNTKVDIKDFEEHRRDVEKALLEARHSGSESLSQYKETMKSTIEGLQAGHKTVAEKLDTLSIRFALAAGGISVITFLSPYLWDLISP